MQQCLLAKVLAELGESHVLTAGAGIVAEVLLGVDWGVCVCVSSTFRLIPPFSHAASSRHPIHAADSHWFVG